MSQPLHSRSLRRDNRALLGKLAVVAVLMFGFGYALVPLYKSICEALGINVLSLSERRSPGRHAAPDQHAGRPFAHASPSSSMPMRAARSTSSRRCARCRSIRANWPR
jgi:hypothetical protein